MQQPDFNDAQTSPAALDEMSSPLDDVSSTPQLAIDTILESTGTSFRIVKVLGRCGTINTYEATDTGAGNGVCVRESADSAGSQSLQREADILRGFSGATFPKVHCFFEWNSRAILVTDLADGPTFGDAIAAADVPFEQILPVLTQVAFAAGQLHRAGWVHLGLRPSSVIFAKPAKLNDFRYVTRIAEKPVAVFFHSGYSAPELLKEEGADPRSDVFSIGAMLIHAVTRQPVSETGPELAGLTAEQLIPGLPQILVRCIGPIDARFPSAIELHQALVELARRLRRRLHFECTGVSTIGLEPSRTTNQDAFGYVSGHRETDTGAAHWLLVTVADGMGGMEAGEVASATAVSTIISSGGSILSQGTDFSADQQNDAVLAWVRAANERVTSALEELRAHGGCTLICALLCDDRLTIGHVGDCRIYLIRNDTWQLLSRDHSLVMTKVLQGEIDLADIRKHPDRSNVTRSLGERKSVPDYFVDSLRQATGSLSLELRSGDVLLLCSDGLWEPVTEDEIMAIVSANSSDFRSGASALVGRALRNGGPDNATVVLVRVH
jgi:protein phosphatase